jgi:hypothetical protein
MSLERVFARRVEASGTWRRSSMPSGYVDPCAGKVTFRA